MKLLILYCAFAYGYGLSLLSEIEKELTYEYRYNIKQYIKSIICNLILWVIFPIIWPFIIGYNFYYCVEDIFKKN